MDNIATMLKNIDLNINTKNKTFFISENRSTDKSILKSNFPIIKREEKNYIARPRNELKIKSVQSALNVLNSFISEKKIALALYY